MLTREPSLDLSTSWWATMMLLGQEMFKPQIESLQALAVEGQKTKKFRMSAPKRKAGRKSPKDPRIRSN